MRTPTDRPLRVLLSAGEPSGDNYAARLVTELRRLDPTVEVAGFAGPRAAEAGLDLRENLLGLSVMGFKQVLARAPTFLSLMSRIKKELDTWQPDVVVPIDYPGLNFLISKWARRRGIPVVFYVSPQLWAWAEWRISKVRRRVDRMLVILPFEEEFYARHGVEVTFVGHPLFDYLRELDLDAGVVAGLRQGRPGPLVAVLPGSREQEIRVNLPPLLAAAGALSREVEGATYVVANPGQDPEIVRILREQVERSNLEGLRLHLGSPYEIMSAADVALVTSGTATLELTFFETPMVVIYQANYPTVIMGRWLTKTDHIALVNILGGGEVVPEYFTHRDCADEMARDARALLPGGERREATLRELRRIKESMGGPGASERAARAVLEMARAGRGAVTGATSS